MSRKKRKARNKNQGNNVKVAIAAVAVIVGIFLLISYFQGTADSGSDQDELEEITLAIVEETGADYEEVRELVGQAYGFYGSQDLFGQAGIFVGEQDTDLVGALETMTPSAFTNEIVKSLEGEISTAIIRDEFSDTIVEELRSYPEFVLSITDYERLVQNELDVASQTEYVEARIIDYGKELEEAKAGRLRGRLRRVRTWQGKLDRKEQELSELQKQPAIISNQKTQVKAQIELSVGALKEIYLTKVIENDKKSPAENIETPPEIIPRPTDPLAVCGDNQCEAAETCLSCQSDCGSCEFGVPGPSTEAVCAWTTSTSHIEYAGGRISGTENKKKKIKTKKDVLDISGPIMKDKINQWVYSDPALYHDVKNRKYDSAVEKIFDEVNAIYYSEDAGYITTRCKTESGPKASLLITDPPNNARGNCVDWANLLVSLIRTLDVQSDRIFMIDYKTKIHGWNPGHAVAVYVSDSHMPKILDVTVKGKMFDSLTELGEWGCESPSRSQWSNDQRYGWRMNGVECDKRPKPLIFCEPGQAVGDFNGDKIIDFGDQQAIWDLYQSDRRLSNVCCVDIDKNGKFQKDDARKIAKYLGKTQPLGICPT